MIICATARTTVIEQIARAEGIVIFVRQLPGNRCQGWGIVHEVFRLHGNGELASVATFQNILDAERLVETLDWEWPGEYVIRHLVMNQTGAQLDGILP